MLPKKLLNVYFIAAVMKRMKKMLSFIFEVNINNLNTSAYFNSNHLKRYTIMNFSLEKKQKDDRETIKAIGWI